MPTYDYVGWFKADPFEIGSMPKSHTGTVNALDEHHAFDRALHELDKLGRQRSMMNWYVREVKS